MVSLKLLLAASLLALSHVQWDTKLDAKIAQAVVSINAFKGVEFGLGFKDAYLKGSSNGRDSEMKRWLYASQLTTLRF